MSSRFSALFACFSLLASFAASATDIQMVAVTSSYPSGYTGKIMTTVDESTGVQSFHFTDSRKKSLVFFPDQLRKGVVLLHELGKDILKISGPDFSNAEGGQMFLTFLKGFFGSDKREVTFDYVRRGDMTDWVLQTDDAEGREPFDTIGVIVSKTIGLPTGVGDITLTAEQRQVRVYDPSKLPVGKLTLEGVDDLLDFSN